MARTLMFVGGIILLSVRPSYSEPDALFFLKRIGVASGGWMNFVAFSPDGKIVASNGGTPEVRDDPVNRPLFHPLSLWTFPEGNFIRNLPAGRRALSYFDSLAYQTLALSPDWRLMATVDAIVEMRTGKRLVAVGRRLGKLAHAAFSPDGQQLAVVRYGRRIDCGSHKEERRKQIVVINTQDGAIVNSFGRRYTSALAVDPAGRRLASGHWDNVTLWDLHTGERMGLLNGFARYVYGVAFSKDGSLLAAGTDSGELQIWDLVNAQRIAAMRIGGGDVSNPVFSPDGKLVAAGTYGGGNLVVIDVATGKIVSDIQVSMFGCGSVDFSPDGRYLIVPSNGGQIGPRRFDTGGTIRVFEVRPNRGIQPTRKRDARG